MPKARHRKFREPCRRVGWISEWRLQAISAADILPESILERPLRSKRHLPRCFLHQMLITLVVASGRRDGGMSHRLPHGVDVGAGLKEPRRKGSAKIMRREGRNRRFVCPGAQQLMDGAGRNRPAGLDVVALLPPPLPSAWHTLALAQHPDDPPHRVVNAEPRNSSVEGRVDRGRHRHLNGVVRHHAPGHGNSGAVDRRDPGISARPALSVLVGLPDRKAACFAPEGVEPDLEHVVASFCKFPRSLEHCGEIPGK